MKKVDRCVQLLRMNIEREKLPFNKGVVREAVEKIKLEKLKNGK